MISISKIFMLYFKCTINDCLCQNKFFYIFLKPSIEVRCDIYPTMHQHVLINNFYLILTYSLQEWLSINDAYHKSHSLQGMNYNHMYMLHKYSLKVHSHAVKFNIFTWQTSTSLWKVKCTITLYFFILIEDL